jgi:cytochrome c-type biogenesis protein CcmH/NrfG
MKHRLSLPALSRFLLFVGLPLMLLAAACPPTRSQTTGTVTVRVSEGATEAPIFQAEVKLLSFGHMSASYWGFTDGGGHTQFPAVEHGTYRVEVKKAGYEIGEEKVDVAAGAICNVFVDLRPTPTASNTLKYLNTSKDTISAQEAAIPAAAKKEFEAGSVLLSSDPSASIPHFRSAVEEYPKYSKAWMTLALAYFKLKQLDDALSAARKSVEADPKLGAAYVLQGRLLVENREFKKAETALLEGLKVAPQAWDAHFELARCYYNTGDIGKALDHARQARDVPESNAVTHLLLADIYLKQNQNKEAIAELEAFAKAEPASPMLPRVQQKIATLRTRP